MVNIVTILNYFFHSQCYLFQGAVPPCCTKVFVSNESFLLDSQTFASSPYVLISHSNLLNLRFSNEIRKYSAHCSVVLYNHLTQTVASTFDERWASELPGGVLYSVHFMFERASPPVQFWSLPFLRRLHHKFVVVTNDDLSVVRFLVTSDALVEQTSSPSLKTLAVKDYDESDFMLYLTRSVRSDLNRDVVYVAVPPTLPQSVFEVVEPFPSNFPVLELKEIARFLNTSLKVFPTSPSVRWGKKLPNGTWTGYVGRVMDDSVDFTFSFIPTVQQYDTALFTKPIVYTPIQFLTPLPKKEIIQLEFLAKPFNASVWIAIFVCIIMNSVCLYVLGIRKRSQTSNGLYPGINRLSVNTTLLARFLMDQPLPDYVIGKASSTLGVRQIFLTWFAVTVVIGSVYKSVVISFLVNPKLVYPPRTVDELLNATFQVNVPLYASLLADNIPWTAHLKKPVRDFGLDMQGCLQTLLEGDNVCLFPVYWLYLRTPRDLIDLSGKKLFMVSKQTLNTIADCFCISPRNPRLKGVLDNVLDALLDGGITQSWFNSVYHYSALKTITRKRKNATTSEMSHAVVDDRLFRHPMLIGSIGLAFSTVVWVLEFLPRLLRIRFVFIRRLYTVYRIRKLK